MDARPYSPRFSFSSALAGLALAFIAIAHSGCASKEKSSAKIHEGEGPTMTYHGREAAGGPLGGF